MDPIDRMPQGDPETVVYLPTGALLGLHIRGMLGPMMLGIREDAEGQPVSCAVVNSLQIDTMQLKPKRHEDREDGA